MMAKSQEKRILAFLKSGRPLTPLQALKKFGCMRLGARVWNLKQDGEPIESELVKVGDKYVAEYRI